MRDDRMSSRVSSAPADAEVALRALLKVKPEDAEGDEPSDQDDEKAATE
jgi:hypothetical protein